MSGKPGFCPYLEREEAGPAGDYGNRVRRRRFAYVLLIGAQDDIVLDDLPGLSVLSLPWHSPVKLALTEGELSGDMQAACVERSFYA